MARKWIALIFEKLKLAEESVRPVNDGSSGESQPSVHLVMEGVAGVVFFFITGSWLGAIGLVLGLLLGKLVLQRLGSK